MFQVRVLTPPEDEEKIPDFEDIFNENEVIIFLSFCKSNTTIFLYVKSSNEDVDSDELDEEESDIVNVNSVEEQQNKRRKLDQSTLVKRRERRRWEENRKKLLFDYTQFSYYGRSVCIFQCFKIFSDSNMHFLFIGCNVNV